MKLEELLAQARAICDQAEKENRDLSDEEREQVKGLVEQARELKQQQKKADEADRLRRQVRELSDLWAGPQPEPEGRTLGEKFLNAAEFKRWFAQVAPGGQIPESARGLMSPPVRFKSLFQKALVTGESDTSAGAFVTAEDSGIYEPLGRAELNVLGMINRRQTGSDLVEFVRQTVRAAQAAPVPESNVTYYSGSSGEVKGQKPEASIAFERVQTPVITVAVWIPATKRALSDAGQLRGIIDQELRADILDELEDQILNGDGTGENFTGILHTAGILNQAWDTDILTTARRAITNLQTNGLVNPTAWVLNPSDWEAIELTQDDNGRYYYAGPQQRGPNTLWGVPVVLSHNIAQGTGLLGDFRRAVLWDREAVTIQVSDSHYDFFVRNMVAILAEMRAAFGVIRPSAFCVVDLEAGT